MLAEIRSGTTVLADGTVAPARATRVGAIAVADAQGKYYEQASRGNIFSMVMTASATNAPAANNLLSGLAAAGAVAFALWNPPGSGKNVSLLKLGVMPVSGTPPVGGLWHGIMATCPTIASSIAAANVGFFGCNNAGMAAASVARGVVTAAGGTALTGCSLPTVLRMADLNLSAGTLASANSNGVKAIEYIDGDIILPPGTGWLPVWSAAGTTFLYGMSVTWEEIPV
jgi:hypothetical protein